MVPIITQLKEEMSWISEKDHGVKGFKKKLLAGIDERMGHFEKEEQYAMASCLDPRLKFM